MRCQLQRHEDGHCHCVKLKKCQLRWLIWKENDSAMFTEGLVSPLSFRDRHETEWQLGRAGKVGQQAQENTIIWTLVDKYIGAACNILGRQLSCASDVDRQRSDVRYPSWQECHGSVSRVRGHDGASWRSSLPNSKCHQGRSNLRSVCFGSEEIQPAMGHVSHKRALQRRQDEAKHCNRAEEYVHLRQSAHSCNRKGKGQATQVFDRSQEALITQRQMRLQDVVQLINHMVTLEADTPV
mmetsp:Transcript_89511/g.286912  ORF Transcript_89511/g.286912 Transcript_89511/m.286912 type:complete len:239 (-) Transcript_89511:930-1646(-)